MLTWNDGSVGPTYTGLHNLVVIYSPIISEVTIKLCYTTVTEMLALSRDINMFHGLGNHSKLICNKKMEKKKT